MEGGEGRNVKIVGSKQGACTDQEWSTISQQERTS